MIVLNEKEYAENCLAKRSLGENPYYSLSVLAKYYYHFLGYRKKRIVILLTDFVSKYYPLYSLSKIMWDENIEKMAKNAGKCPLYQIDGVSITVKEMETIKGIHNKVLERLAFTMLCLAKLGDMKNPKNKGWVNYNAKDIFNLARISCSASDRFVKFGKLGII